jgi:hypothetical protein
MTKKAPKKWNKEKIRFMLETDNRWLFKGLMAIYNRQTEDEKATELTHHHNMIGFNGVDANLLTSYAKQYKERGFLTKGQIDWCRKKMLKYAGQLAKIANGEIP